MTIFSCIHGLLVAAHKLLIEDCGWEKAVQRVQHALDAIAHTALELETLYAHTRDSRVSPQRVMSILAESYSREMTDLERETVNALVARQLSSDGFSKPNAGAELAGLVGRVWGYDARFTPDEHGQPRATAAVNLLLALAHELRRRV